MPERTRVDHRQGKQEERAPQAEPRAPTPQEQMLQIQRTAGNAAAARVAASGALLQRSVLEDIGNTFRRGAGMLGHEVAGGLGLETPEQVALGQAETFFDTGPYHGEVTPGGKGVGGGFEGVYDPPKGDMTVKMRCAVKFWDSIIVGPDGTLSPAEPALAGLVAHANTLTGADRLAFIAAHQWESAEKGPWKTDLESLIEGAWGSSATGHEFHVHRDGWDWIGAKVKIDLDVHDAPRKEDDHILIETIKFPPGENMYSFAGSAAGRSFSRVHEGHEHDDAHDQNMVVASTDISARQDFNVLHREVHFEHNSAQLTSAARKDLDKWIKTFQGADDKRSIKQKFSLIGHASQSGSEEYNQKLSDRRVEAVRQYLASKKFLNLDSRVEKSEGHGEDEASAILGGAAGVLDWEGDRRVDIIVGTGSPQNLAVHEFGHAFGLDDEYADTPLYGGSGKKVGDPVRHDDATKKMLDSGGNKLPGAIAETTDSIMSAGNVIRPQHYSTFHAALRKITGVEEWALGPPKKKPTPGSGP